LLPSYGLKEKGLQDNVGPGMESLTIKPRQRPIRWFLAGFFVPLLLTAVLWQIGVHKGAENNDSAGARYIDAAELIHVPAYFCWFVVIRSQPLTPDVENDYEEGFLMLKWLAPSSCLCYGLLAWLVARMRLKMSRRPLSAVISP
jgi:hypothetical protein